MSEPDPAPGAGLATLRAYRARLKARGQLLDVRVVDRCITLLLAAENPSKTTSAGRMDAGGDKLRGLDSFQTER